MKICVFGLWHLGSVIAAGLAESGHTVTGLDFDQEKIGNLRNARAPIAESGLNELILKNLREKKLSFTYAPQSALADAEVLWIAFDTPVDEQDNADPGYIEKNFEAVAEFLPDRIKILISSQVPVGFTRTLARKFHEKYPDKKAFFAYSPENLRLGKALKTFLEPDRIVIGTESDEKEMFFPVFLPVSDRLEWMSIESAEMTKHAINSFLATSICFANEIATLCEYVGADAKEVERGLKTEERIGPKAYLTPGNAFSGGTLARDIRFLQKLGDNNHLPVYLINAVLNSNDFHKTWIKRKCREALGDLKGKHISVLGLTYKPGTDTLRRSFSVELCTWLHNEGATVTAFDPAIHELPPELQKILLLSPDSTSAVKNADCLIIATEWPEFRKIKKDTLIEMRTKILIDPDGFVEKNLGTAQNIRYLTVGRDLS
ncbi:MAG: nucleotide sugar dehydrogenase [Methanoregula sp.]|nr:nucleotide sugar dehydrogenase [Methanoregula sp.]